MFKIKDKKVGFGGGKLPVGRFRCALQKIAPKTSENKKFKTNGDALCVLEWKVKEIFNQTPVDEVQPDKKRFVLKEVAVDNTIGWAYKMKNDASGSNLISLCAAHMGVENPQDADEVQAATEILEEGVTVGDVVVKDWDEYLAALMDPKKNPALDHEIIIETRLKRQGEDFFFIVYNFYPVTDEATAAA